LEEIAHLQALLCKVRAAQVPWSVVGHASTMLDTPAKLADSLRSARDALLAMT